MSFERVLRWALVAIAVVGLAAGIAAHAAGRSGLADLSWTLATAPVVAGLAVSIVRDFLAGRFGVDAIALVSMSAALALGQPLAGAVVALMYSGGNVLEDIAVARAEHDLRSLVDRAPREAHRRVDDRIEEVPISAVAVGDRLLVRAGEIIPVDGVVTSNAATIDESALTGEPIPVVKARGAAILSGSLNVGETFELTVSAAAGESTYAGIVRLVTAAQTAKAPFVRLADRYALVFLPVTLALAFVAWLISGDLIRSLAVLVAATPCPLDSGGAGRLHRRRCASRPARHPGQGRRAAGGAGARPHRAVRQDRNVDGRRRAAAFGRGRARRVGRRGLDARRLAGAGVASCSRQRHRSGRGRARPEPQSARAGKGIAWAPGCTA